MKLLKRYFHIEKNKKTAPDIRFKGFVDDWDQRKLGEISESLEYGLNVAAKEFDGTNKYLRITDIDDESRRFKTSALTSPDIDLSNANNYKLETGDVLFARTGASVGKTYHYSTSDGVVYYAGFLIRARIGNDFNYEFIFQNTLTQKYKKYIKLISQRSGQPGVNAQEYANYRISIPSLDEQQKIGSLFKTLDDTIAFHQRKLELLKQLKKAYLQQLFPIKEEIIPNIRFINFKDNWKKCKLKELGNIQTGNTPPTNDKNNYDSRGTLWITPSDINSLVITDTSKKLSSKGLSKAKVAKPGSILVTSIASIGKNTLATMEVAFNQQINSLTPFPINDSYFLLTQSELWSKKMKHSAASGTMQIVNKMEFSNIISLVPQKGEQKIIGDFFKKIDSFIILEQQQINYLKKIKMFYLSKLFL